MMGMAIIKRALSSLQMLACYCLPSSFSSRTIPTPPPPPSIRLIAADGRVKVFSRPVPASELMRQHPLHLVCRSDSLFIGQKVPALSPSDHLQPGHSYFLLPSHFFHSALSFLTLSTSLTISSKDNKDAAPLLRSFDIRKTETGMLQVRLRDEMIADSYSSDVAAEIRPPPLRICSSEELEKEYRQMVGCRLRQWKPRLDTITESSAAAASSSSKTSRRRAGGHELLLLIRKRKKKVQC